MPVNASCSHKAEGASSARLIALNDMRYLMGLYRNETFIFNNDAPMSARQRKAVEAGFEVNLSRQMPQQAALSRGDSVIGADLTTLAAKSAGLAKRQMQGSHLLGVTGEGYTLSFESETSDIVKTDWQHGVLTGLPGMTFHQHFNAHAAPTSLMTVELGSLASPMFRSRRAAYGDTDVYASGHEIIPRANERADISKHRLD